MISHFWNLCKACPALEAEKLYSEYRSTYKWHEAASSASASNPASLSTSTANEVVVKHPPKSSNADDFHFPRKKKHPELAYRSHEFFDPSLAPAFPTRASHNAESEAVDHTRERRRQRREGFKQAQRRAQSEGPGIRNPLFRLADHHGGSEIRPALSAAAAAHSRPASAKRRAANHRGNDDVQDGSPMLSSYPPPAPSSKWSRQTTTTSGTENRSSSSSRQPQMKESVSMGQIDSAKDTVGNEGEGQSEDVGTKSMSASQDITSRSRREYRSEYKQRFRPFSQYEYLGEGRFVPNNGQISPPTATTGKAPSMSKQFTRQQQKEEQQVLALQQKATSLQGEPWYREVVELRKQANDYKCRGWGTDLVPPHMTDLYHKQIELHEAAARRESLSALSLAINSPRPTEATSAKLGSTSDRISPSKSASLGRQPRPRTAPPPNRASSKSSRSESAHPISDTGALHNRRSDVVDSAASRRPPIAGARAKSPTKRVASRPPSASTASSSVAPSPAPCHGEAKQPPIQAQAQQQPPQQPPKRQRPTTLNTTTSTTPQQPQQQQAKPRSTSNDSEAARKAKSTRIEALKCDSRDFPSHNQSKTNNQMAPLNDNSCAGSVRSAASSGMPDFSRRPFSRSSSTKGGVAGATSVASSRPPSAFENNIDYFREPVVKSPPEPTRVKSPEAVVRSPDPINWTVPLDTGKTFSVTQSIKDGESSRHSPMSDHSSLFDSVSGTAINLGRGVPAPLHGSHQRISSLAKEARDLQPGLIKDSTLMRPAFSSSNQLGETTNRPTEAHPNPSIPEEENVKDDGMPTSDRNGGHVNGSKAFKCIEEPSFEFEAAKEATTTPKKPSYRVLEDPYETAKANYRVLEDPMTTAMYDASTSSEAMSHRPPASEVLEGAREKFDKFWGSKKAMASEANNEP